MRRVVVIGVVVLAALTPVTGTAAQPSTIPQNIVLILTDDQVFNTLRFMPHVVSLLQAHGVTFTNAFDNNPLCCPTRTTILTGLTSGHNGVWTNNPATSGGFPTFVANGDQNRQIFLWLHDLGYRTAFIGKFLNFYNVSDDAWILPGVDEWHVFNLENLAHTGCEVGGYYGTCYSDNGTLVHHPASEYSTSETGNEVVSFITDNDDPSSPLFIEYAPRAPHLPTVPIPAYRTRCPNVPKITSRATFNKVIVNGPAYTKALPWWNAKKTAEQQTLWRRDCQTLLSVDNQVGRIVTALKNTGRLQNTLLVFASDNGYLFGQHRWLGKEVPYESSIRVPVVVRDDAVIPPAMQGTTVNAQITSLDYTPTFLQAAGASRTLDGQSLFPLFDGNGTWIPQDPLLIEHVQGPTPGSVAPTYCGVRASGFMYAQYATGEEELYDLTEDPLERTNVAADPAYASVLANLRARTHLLCDPTPPGFTWTH